MKAVLAAVAAVNAASVEEKAATKKCLALTMSGGGTKGSYEAGALWGMYYALSDKTQMQYDVVTGVSAGSINTMLVAMYPKGQEKQMLDDMSYRWQTLKQDDLYVQWYPLGMLTGLATKTGLLNTEPLGKYFTDFCEAHNWDFKRKFAMSYVDVNSGNYVVYDEKTPKDTVKAALSSSAIPFVFPNQKWPDGHVAMDGGTVWNTNIISAIEKCREQVDDDSQITIDIVTCQQAHLVGDWTNQKNALSNFLRNFEV